MNGISSGLSYPALPGVQARAHKRKREMHLEMQCRTSHRYSARGSVKKITGGTAAAEVLVLRHLPQFLFRRGWEFHGKGRALSRLAVEADITALRQQHLLRRGEAQAGPGGLGSEIG